MAGNYIPYIRRDYLNISGGTITGDTAVLAALTATTYYSGSTPLETIIYNIAESTEDITRLQNGINTYTGGTSNLPTVNISGLSIDNIYVSGGSRFNSLSATSISAGSISLETLSSAPAYKEGLVFYGPDGLSSYLDDSGVTLNIGQEQYIKVYNGTGALIQNGKAVTIVGSDGSSFPRVELAIASGGTSDLFHVDGIATHDIEDGSYGYITNFGLVREVDLSSFNEGDVVYLSESVYGGLTDLSSLSVTARTCEIGHVIINSSSGLLQVNLSSERKGTENTIKELNILNANNTSSGVFAFGGINLESTTTFNIGAVKGWIVDSTTNAIDPLIQYVEFAGLSGQTTPYLNTDTQTYILLTSAGTITYQNSYPTPPQRRQNIYLGKLGHANRSTLINAFNEPDYSIAPLSQVRDFFTPIKFVNGGVTPSANGANLTFNVSSGSLYGFGIGVKDNPLNPNSISISGSSPATFQYRTQTGGTASNTTLIDPTKYDNSGLITSVGGGSNSSTNQRIYMTQNGVIRIQYGQQVYSTLSEAISNVQNENFVTFSNFRDNAILIGIISTKRTATDLSDSSQAKFLFVSKFGESIGAAGGISTTTLQQAYDNSSTPEIITNSTLDGFQIRGGTGSDSSKNLIIENNSGGETAWIKASGEASFSGVTSPWVSGNTYYSGNTPLSTVINNIASQYSAVTYIQNGLNTYTGGTANLPTVNISGASLDNIFVSGSSRLNTLTGGTISGGTLFSGSTPLSTIINNIASQYSGNTYVQGGLNTYTGGTTSLPTVNVSGASLDNIFVSGSSRFNTLTGGTISGGTLFSGSTPLSTIINNIASQYSAVTYVQNGLNTYTGGTANLPTVNVSGASLDNIFVSGSSRFNVLTGGTMSGGTYYSGSTPLSTIIANIASGLDTNDVTRVQGGLNTYTGGTTNLPTVNVSGASLDNIFVSGISRFNSISGGTISGNTYYSGSTPLDAIIHSISASYSGASGDHTRIQGGLNTYTGGTSSLPTINVSGLSIDNIFVSGSSRFNTLTGGTISGGTYFSGSTPLETIITSIASGLDTNDVTRVQGGLNTYTGGTANLPTVNISGGSFNDITLSGELLHYTSGDFTYSGRTALANGVSVLKVTNSNIIYSNGPESGNYSSVSGEQNVVLGSNHEIGSGATHTLSQGFNHFVTGTTSSSIVGGYQNRVYESSNALIVGQENILSASSNTFVAGSFNENYQADHSIVIGEGNINNQQHDSLVGGFSNTNTGNAIGGSIVWGISNVNYGNRSTVFGGSNSILDNSNRSFVFGSNNTVFNLSTDSSILGGTRNVLSGSNIYSSIISGFRNALSATTSSLILGGSGNTIDQSRGALILGGSGNTIGGNSFFTIIVGGEKNIILPSVLNSAIVAGSGITASENNTLYTNNVLSTLNISGGTYYSGSTPLETIITNIASGLDTNDVTRVQGGLNTYTGGTANLPTVNVSGLSIDNIFVSGNSRFNTLTGGTISGGTYYSGSTPLETIITNIASGLDTNDVTRVQHGLNTYTGGTANLPTVNVSGATLDNIFVSGSSSFNTLTGGTISGDTYFSGSTPLETIITNIASGLDTNDVTRVQSGLNTYTGGTANLPTINVSAATLDNIFVSGDSRFNTLTGGTISGGTYYSGSTPLETIITSLIPPAGSSTSIQNGLNTYTGGTSSLPTVNVSGATLDSIFVSGSSRFNALTGGTISGGTYYSGSTPLETIINNSVSAGRFLPLSGGTVVGTTNVVSNFNATGNTVFLLSSATATFIVSGFTNHSFGVNKIVLSNTGIVFGGVGTSSGNYSAVFGVGNTASNTGSFASGSGNTASGIYSRAEGFGNTASGSYSHAQGFSSTATIQYAHAEGYSTRATASEAHSEGQSTLASGQASHTEGYLTTGSSFASHAEGRSTLASADYSHAEGYLTRTTGQHAHAEGDTTVATGQSSHAEGRQATSNGGWSHAEGWLTNANGVYAHAEGQQTTATGFASHTEGATTQTVGNYSHAEGTSTRAYGDYSHSEGDQAIASGYSSHAEGYQTEARANYSHAEGRQTLAAGLYSHAEGYLATASGDYSHAEGFTTTASTLYAHSEGQYTRALGQASRASGGGSATNTGAVASGDFSFAHYYGNLTTVSGASKAYSFVLGGVNHSVNVDGGGIVGGTGNTINGGGGSIILGGSGNTITSGNFNAILGSNKVTITGGTNIVVLGKNDGFTPGDSNTTYMYNADIESVLDLRVPTALPTPKSGRIFYSANTLFIYTGNTSGDLARVQLY